MRRFLPIFFILISALVLNSCASYYAMSSKYQTELESGNYEKAYKFVKKNSYLKKKRNYPLQLLEQGKLAFLVGQYEESNRYFNSFDSLIEENSGDLGNQIIGAFTNPEMERYKPEDYEKVVIHYYKALNYLNLKKHDAALVEVKRLNLRLYEINDKYPADKKNRYTSDAFALSLQGMIYESMNDINNAFIAYRNAVDLYLKHAIDSNPVYFNTSIPYQLVDDLLRTANQMGFYNDVSHYRKILKVPQDYQSQTYPNGSLIVFWEKGLIPYKTSDALTFFTGTSGGGFVNMNNEETGLNISVPITSNFKDGSLSMVSVAFAKFMSRASEYKMAKISKKGYAYPLEKTEDFEFIAIKNLEDRRAREIGKAVIRLTTKKITEALAESKAEGLGSVLSIVNALTEKADTRNWQSLPSQIYYSRIPLDKGENKLTFTLETFSGATKTDTLTVNNKGGIHFETLSTY
ncbi:MAG: hypothetical protein N4A45_04985 [Flavobacteriales bacterium]|nr:hypothetical protein [Flavobacteriales bacterium]